MNEDFPPDMMPTTREVASLLSLLLEKSIAQSKSELRRAIEHSETRRLDGETPKGLSQLRGKITKIRNKIAREERCLIVWDRSRRTLVDPVLASQLEQANKAAELERSRRMSNEPVAARRGRK